MHNPATQPRVIWRLVEESVSEAAFLWGRLDQALEAPEYTLTDAERWVQERLDGALDGVLLAGDAAVDLLMEACADSDPGYASVAVYLLTLLHTPAATQALEVGLRALAPEHLDAAVAGLRRTADVAHLAELHARLAGQAPVAEAALVEAISACGAPVDLDWRGCLTSNEPALRRAAASALGQQPSDKRREVMWLALQSPDRDVRTRAIYAGVLAGDSNAWSHCVESLQTPDACSRPLLCLASTLGARDEHALVIKAAARAGTAADALWALGFAGTRAAIDSCVAHSASGERAAVALDAISWATGVSASELAQIQMDSAAHGGGIQEWWERERSRFAPDKRYQHGKLVDLASLRHVLESGPAHRRHAVAAELCARTRSAHFVQTWAFCGVQREQLAALAALDLRELRDIAKAAGFASLEDA